LKASSKNNRATILISLACLIGFLLLALLRGNFSGINREVNSWVTTIQTSSFTLVAKLIAGGFDTTPLLAISLVIGAVLFYKKMRKNALLLVGAMAGDAVIIETLKTFIYSLRPLNGLVLETDNSFPSGHVTSTVVLLGLLAFFAWQTWKCKLVKAASSVLLAAVALFVGFTRIYLNVHWLSDVLAGYLLGVFWLTFCIAITPYLKQAYMKLRKAT
jgi:membrane-associated phospholipid phosphatase